MFDLLESGGGNDLFDQLLLRSQKEMDDTVKKVQNDTRTRVQAEQAEQTKNDFFSTLEVEDKPGQNILTDFINGKIGANAPRRVETFEEFISKRNPAADFLTSIAQGQLARLHGKQGKSHREKLFEEFQVEQRGQIAQQQMEQQNARTAVTLASAQKRLREDIASRMEMKRIDLIEDKKEREAAQLRWSLEHNVSVAEFQRKLSNDKAEREEDRLNRITDSKVPLVGEFRKQINDEFPGLHDKNPIEFNSKVMERYDTALAKESNQKIAEKRAGRKVTKSFGNFGPQQVESTLERVLRGDQSLASARNELTSSDKDPSAYWKMVELGEGRIIRNKAVREDFAKASNGLAVSKQLTDLAIEAKKIAEQSKAGLFNTVDPDPESSEFQGLKAELQGALTRLTGSVGSNAAATVFERLIPGMATTLARAGGETGRISDADVMRFVKQAPNLSDSLDEVLILQREITKTIGSRLLTTVRQDAPTLGERKVDETQTPMNVWQFLIAHQQDSRLGESMGGTDPIEAFVKAWEQGRRFTF